MPPLSPGSQWQCCPLLYAGHLYSAPHSTLSKGLWATASGHPHTIGGCSTQPVHSFAMQPYCNTLPMYCKCTDHVLTMYCPCTVNVVAMYCKFTDHVLHMYTA